MEDDTEIISQWLATVDELDESHEYFRALCLRRVKVCSSFPSAVLRGRALARTEAAFLDALAAIREAIGDESPLGDG
jgi:hypothetical protein